MTLRERLADWISGGALSRAVQENKDWFAQVFYWSPRYSEYKRALADIAAMETPSANATVKRMAQRAKEALE